jgi:hypothetical protein
MQIAAGRPLTNRTIRLPQAGSRPSGVAAINAE